MPVRPVIRYQAMGDSGTAFKGNSKTDSRLCTTPRSSASLRSTNRDEADAGVGPSTSLRTSR